MKIKVGDKIVSDDYAAIGILTQINDKLMLIGDFGSVEYEPYNADWIHYNIWKANLKKICNHKKIMKYINNNALINVPRSLFENIIVDVPDRFIAYLNQNRISIIKITENNQTLFDTSIQNQKHQEIYSNTKPLNNIEHAIAHAILICNN